MVSIDNLACVVTYFDEDHEAPADYVLKWADGFEAFVARVTDDMADSISLGRYPTMGLACHAIEQWNEVGTIGRPMLGGGFDFNPPLKN